MKRASCSVFAFWLILLTASAARAQAVVAPPAPAAVDARALDTLVTERLKGRDLVGLSVTVAHQGKIVLAKGYGQRSLEPQKPVEPETLFAIGSITKQFTATCILLLAEDGKLSVEDKVAKYYPDLTRANDIALVDLMNHVSGYPDYYPLDFVDRPMQKPIAEDDLIRQFGTRTLDFEPGTRWSYSNTGFVILGRVVEKVSGEKLGAFLARRIFKPLGMTHTAYEPAASGDAFAVGYMSFLLSPPEIPAREGKGWVAAAGALWSTASDLATWDLALMDGKVLKPESFRLMTTPRRLADGTSTNYGCGLTIGSRNGETVYSHGGAVAGFGASNQMIPGSRSAVITLSNSTVALPGVTSGLVAALLPARTAPPAPVAPQTPAPRPTPTGVPQIAGPAAADVAREVLLELQTGKVDRSRFGDEFNFFLTDKQIEAAAERLKPYGEPGGTQLMGVSERGGMEVSRVRVTLASGTLVTQAYRTRDGKIQQFFVNKE